MGQEVRSREARQQSQEEIPAGLSAPGGKEAGVSFTLQKGVILKHRNIGDKWAMRRGERKKKTGGGMYKNLLGWA